MNGTWDLPWLIQQLHQVLANVRPTTLAAGERHRDPFLLLVACVISLRAKDAVTAAAGARLFAAAATPSALARLEEEHIAALIFSAGFYRTKARQLMAIAHRLLTQYGEAVPANREALLALPGVGRKTANLVLGLAFRIPAICVDTHVHRIVNRLGLVRTGTPKQSETALQRVVPRQSWIAIDDQFVTFGQSICRLTSPRCSTCPSAQQCPHHGVKHHR